MQKFVAANKKVSKLASIICTQIPYAYTCGCECMCVCVCMCMYECIHVPFNGCAALTETDSCGMWHI